MLGFFIATPYYHDIFHMRPPIGTGAETAHKNGLNGDEQTNSKRTLR
jgi:hypothetical protein